MSWGYVAVGAATVVTGMMSSDQASDASRDAVNASSQATGAQLYEARRQFDLQREDSAPIRELGGQATSALSYLLGVRQPPSPERITTLESQLADLRSELSSMETGGEVTREAPKTDLSGLRYDVNTGRHYNVDGGSVDPNANPRSQSGGYNINRQQLESEIQDISVQLDEARTDYQMAEQLSGGTMEVPDISMLMENVEMPQIDDFLNGIGKGLVESDFYQFELKQGREALDNFMTSRGSAYGGNAMRGAMEYGQDYATSKGMQLYDVKKNEAVDQYKMNLDKYNLQSKERQQQVGNLFTAAGYGQNAAAASAGAGQNYASQVGSATARHAQTVGNAAYTNAATNISAMNNAVNTGMTLWQYNQNRPNAPVDAGAYNPDTYRGVA